MIDLSHEEAQLFRMLIGFFGREHVVPRMRVIAVCGGTLPDSVSANNPSLPDWARANTCLFTIVDRQDNPRLVVDLGLGFADVVDTREEEHQRLLTPLLQARGIPYITISNDEFSEVLDPEGGLDFFTLLRAKIEEQGVHL